MMVRTSLSTTLLPRARVLTDALLAPPAPTVSESELIGLRMEIESEMSRLYQTFEADRFLRIDAYRLREAHRDHHDQRPFAWNPWTARRPIALEALRIWMARPKLSPLRAVDAAVESLRARADGRARSLGEWLGGLPTGARAVVQAEAVTLATQLVGALEWGRLEAAAIGSDRSVAFEAVPRVRLHARIDVRIPLSDNPDGTEANALFLAMTGRPGPTTPEELGLAALTVALHPRLGFPARVIGWWPQCGRAAIADVDLGLLRRTTDAVLRAVGPETPERRQPTQPINIGRGEPANRATSALHGPGEVAIAS